MAGAGIFTKGLGWLLSGGAVIILGLLGKWLLRIFVRATDVTVGFNWSFEGRKFHPNLDIRNRSQSKTYRLAAIRYKVDGLLQHCDNTSVMDKELKPSSMMLLSDVAVVPRVSSFDECRKVLVVIVFQDGREVVGDGMGYEASKVRRIGRKLRAFLDRLSVSLDG